MKNLKLFLVFAALCAVASCEYLGDTKFAVSQEVNLIINGDTIPVQVDFNSHGEDSASLAVKALGVSGSKCFPIK